MQEIHSQADKLLAYIDGELAADEIETIEDLLKNDSDAQAFVEKMQTSTLPFKESFDHLLDVNNELVEELSHHVTSQKPQTHWRLPLSMAASLLLGLSIGFFAFVSQYEDHDNWIVRVADYHLLYVRDTVKGSLLNATQVSNLKTKLGSAIATDLNIPDLSAQKLDFKRGQILDANGKPLVQLAYLPESGLPVALCILRDDKPDALPKPGESRGLPFITWSKNGLSYVIIGNIPKQTLKAAALNAVAQIAG